MLPQEDKRNDRDAMVSTEPRHSWRERARRFWRRLLTTFWQSLAAWQA